MKKIAVNKTALIDTTSIKNFANIFFTFKSCIRIVFQTNTFITKKNTFFIKKDKIILSVLIFFEETHTKL
jgi:hypothetical protein